MATYENMRESARREDGKFGHWTRDESPVALPVRSRRRKSAAVTAALTGLLASVVLTGCTPSGDVVDADYAKVCQDRTTKERVEDSKCSEEGRSSTAAGWYFLPMMTGGSNHATSVPAVGQKLTGGVTTLPKAKTAKAGVSSKGASVTRGGFGSSAKGSSFGG